MGATTHIPTEEVEIEPLISMSTGLPMFKLVCALTNQEIAIAYRANPSLPWTMCFWKTEHEYAYRDLFLSMIPLS
jgi:hypothetical protein